MTSAIEKSDTQAQLVEQVVIQGDLSKLSAADRVQHYRMVCDSLGLNYLTKPFEYITLNGKLTLYAKRDATDQLRRRDSISIVRLDHQRQGDLYLVVATAKDKGGRTDSSIGAVSVAGLRGDPLANAMMKAETKAKRRVTLSIAGLGWLDETEASAVPEARPAGVDLETGEITSLPEGPLGEAPQTGAGEANSSARALGESRADVGDPNKPACSVCGDSVPQEQADGTIHRFGAVYCARHVAQALRQKGSGRPQEAQNTPKSGEKVVQPTPRESPFERLDKRREELGVGVPIAKALSAAVLGKPYDPFIAETDGILLDRAFEVYSAGAKTVQEVAEFVIHEAYSRHEEIQEREASSI